MPWLADEPCAGALPPTTLTIVVCPASRLPLHTRA